jgi:hypothetical protein
MVMQHSLGPLLCRRNLQLAEELAMIVQLDHHSVISTGILKLILNTANMS